MNRGNKMRKAIIKETWRDEPSYIGGNRRIWIVSHNGQSNCYYFKKEAQEAKTKIDN